MYELLYASLATDSITGPEVKKILQASKANNEKHGITGMLVYSETEFVQLLEGEQIAVKTLYNKIRQDKRHRNTKIFYEGAIRSRSFDSWAMASQSLKVAIEKNNEIGEMINETGPTFNFRYNPNQGKKIFAMLREFI